MWEKLAKEERGEEKKRPKGEGKIIMKEEVYRRKERDEGGRVRRKDGSKKSGKRRLREERSGWKDKEC